jgi:hypothetical protein
MQQNPSVKKLNESNVRNSLNLAARGCIFVSDDKFVDFALPYGSRRLRNELQVAVIKLAS